MTTPAATSAALVAVADRTPVYLAGLAGVLSDVGYDTVTAASSVELRDVLGKAPDVLVVDLRIASAEPVLCAEASAAGVAVVVVVPANLIDEAMAIIEIGVAGLVDRDGDVMDLRRIVAGALSGSTLMSADVGGAILARISSTSSALRGLTGRLTSREREVLRLMAEGMGNRSISEKLFISENTVRNHVRNILEKLQAQSRTEAVVRALRAGLVRVP